jgi:integrase
MGVASMRLKKGRRGAPIVLLIDAGVNPKAIQEFMGHATIEETFSRYGHLMPGTRDQARELVDAYMTTAMEESI